MQFACLTTACLTFLTYRFLTGMLKRPVNQRNTYLHTCAPYRYRLDDTIKEDGLDLYVVVQSGIERS